MTEKKSLLTKFADRYELEPSTMLETLKATAFKIKEGIVTNEQMTALVLVADQYGLNPFTKEIYAFPDKQNGIVPVVGVDGWSRIINSNPAMDGMEFVYSDNQITPDGGKPCPEWCEVTIYRKDRTRPVTVREYLDEVYRPLFKGKYGDVTGPWQTHTKRMLRHKAMIQAARTAFGFGGIYDPDEAERIIEGQEAEQPAPVNRSEAQLPAYTAEQMAENLPKWEQLIVDGRQTPQSLLATLSTKFDLTDDQKAAITALGNVVDGEYTEGEAA